MKWMKRFALAAVAVGCMMIMNPQEVKAEQEEPKGVTWIQLQSDVNNKQRLELYPTDLPAKGQSKYFKKSYDYSDLSDDNNEIKKNGGHPKPVESNASDACWEITKNDENTYTMKLLRDTTYAHNDGATFTIKADANVNVVLDLAGHSLTLESTKTTVIALEAGVNLTITGDGSLTAKSLGESSTRASVVSCTGGNQSEDYKDLTTSFRVESGKVSLTLDSQLGDRILYSVNGIVTFEVSPSAILEMNSVTGKNFVKEGESRKETKYIFNGEPWTMDEINQYVEFGHWIAGTHPVKNSTISKG